jgi:hypothetical protein
MPSEYFFPVGRPPYRYVANCYEHEQRHEQRRHVFHLLHLLRSEPPWALDLCMHGSPPGPQPFAHSRRIAELVFGPPDKADYQDPRYFRRYGENRLLYRDDPRDRARYPLIIEPQGMWPLKITLPAAVSQAVAIIAAERNEE